MIVWCASLESGIQSYGGFCVVPNKGGCSPPDGSYLIFTKKEGLLVMQPIRFLFSTRMELFITSTARKMFVHRVTVFLFYFVPYVLLFLELFMNGIWILIDYFRSQLSSFLLLYLFFTSYDHRPNFWVMLLHFSSNSNIPEVLLPFQAWPIKILLSRG